MALPMPVPNAFETASFAAKRAAKWRAGNFIDWQYAISPAVKMRWRKRSPNDRANAGCARSRPDPPRLPCTTHSSSIVTLRHSLMSASISRTAVFEPDQNRPRHDGMADVQVHQVRNFVDERDVAVIDAVACIHLEIEIRPRASPPPQPFEFLLLDFLGVGIGQFPGMQFHHVRAECDRRIDLFANRIDEHAHADAGGVKPLHRRRQLFPMGHHIKTAFRCDFLRASPEPGRLHPAQSAMRYRRSRGCCPSRDSAW